MSIDPRDLFVRLNPLGLDERDLEKDSTGFADDRTHNDYLVFLAGYKAGTVDGEGRECQRHRPINAEGCKPDLNTPPPQMVSRMEAALAEFLRGKMQRLRNIHTLAFEAGWNARDAALQAELPQDVAALREDIERGNRIQLAMAQELSIIAQAIGFEPEEQPGGEGIATAIRVLRTQLSYLGKHFWDLLEHYELSPSVRKKAEAALSGAADPYTLSTAACDVLGERLRQAEAEGYTLEQDDEYTQGQLADAASAYAAWARTWNMPYTECTHTPAMWPWASEGWKPQSQRRMLVKAGALILAEIERLDRQQAREVCHD